MLPPGENTFADDGLPEAGWGRRRDDLLHVAAHLQQELGHVGLLDGLVVAVVDAALQQDEGVVLERAVTNSYIWCQQNDQCIILY